MQTMAAADCWANFPQALLIAEIVTRVQDPISISASHTDAPREAKQNPVTHFPRNVQFSGLKICPILGCCL